MRATTKQKAAAAATAVKRGTRATPVAARTPISPAPKVPSVVARKSTKPKTLYGHNSPTSAASVTAREREVQVLEMRKQGYSFRQIGEHLGISDIGAAKALRRMLSRMAENLTETVEEVRRLELERLDKMLVALNPGVSTGDVRAVEAALRIQDRRSKLLGLDAATKFTVGGEVGVRLYEGVDVKDV